MATVNISALAAAVAGNLTGAAIVPTTDSTVTTVKATLAQLRTALLAGGAGYASTDPCTLGSDLTITGVVVVTSPADAAMLSGKTAVNGDRLDLVVRAAGNGVQINAYNFGATDFSPALIQANGLTVKSRTGVGTSATVALFSNAATTFTGTLTVNGAVQLGTAASSDLITIGGTGYGAGVASVRFNGLTTAAVNNQVGTLTNAPVVGNPTFWMPVSHAGTIRYIPCW